MQAHSLYIHIPFCQHRCAYCDFNTYAGLDSLIPNYVDALVRELTWLAQDESPLHTIFFGGGTPSLLSVEQVGQILHAVRGHFDLLPDAEINLEANPGTTSQEFLNGIRELGVNRLSLGLQSVHSEELLLLERIHTFDDALQAVSDARQAGFDNLNLDLMFALPGQSLANWERSLELALQVNPEHFSLYSLTFEHGTPFSAMLNRGLLTVPSEDRAADMYRMAQKIMKAAGYAHYEISNWAKRDDSGEPLSSRHNLQYWKNDPYLGVGAGAHGWIDRYRTKNVLGPAAYIERLNDPRRQPRYPRTPATVEARLTDQEGEMAETMMMGLRLLDLGISESDFQHRFGFPITERYGKEIAVLEEKELLRWSENGTRRLVLTEKGRFLGNQVFMEFV